MDGKRTSKRLGHRISSIFGGDSDKSSSLAVPGSRPAPKSPRAPSSSSSTHLKSPSSSRQSSSTLPKSPSRLPSAGSVPSKTFTQSHPPSAAAPMAPATPKQPRSTARISPQSSPQPSPLVSPSSNRTKRLSRKPPPDLDGSDDEFFFGGGSRSVSANSTIEAPSAASPPTPPESRPLKPHTRPPPPPPQDTPPSPPTIKEIGDDDDPTPSLPDVPPPPPPHQSSAASDSSNSIIASLQNEIDTFFIAGDVCPYPTNEDHSDRTSTSTPPRHRSMVSDVETVPSDIPSPVSNLQLRERSDSPSRNPFLNADHSVPSFPSPNPASSGYDESVIDRYRYIDPEGSDAIDGGQPVSWDVMGVADDDSGSVVSDYSSRSPSTRGSKGKGPSMASSAPYPIDVDESQSFETSSQSASPPPSSLASPPKLRQSPVLATPFSKPPPPHTGSASSGSPAQSRTLSYRSATPKNMFRGPSMSQQLEHVISHPIANPLTSSSPTVGSPRHNHHRQSSSISSLFSSSSYRPVNLATIKKNINLRPGEGERSNYVNRVRRTHGTAYNETEPGKWKLPIGIMPVDKSALAKNANGKYMRLAGPQANLRKAKTSGVELKHGHLKQKLLAGEIDERDLESPTMVIGGPQATQPRVEGVKSSGSSISTLKRSETMMSTVTSGTSHSLDTGSSALSVSSGSSGSLQEEFDKGYYQHPAYDEDDEDEDGPSTGHKGLVLANPDTDSD